MGELLKEDNEIMSAKSPFSSFPNEKKVEEGNVTQLSLELIMLKASRGNISAEDFVLLKGIDELQFSTSRMLATYMSIKKNETDLDLMQSKISNRLKSLIRNDIISRYGFYSEYGNNNLKAFFLKRAGKYLLISRNYPCNWKPTDNAKLIDDVKEILARNNLLLTMLCKVENIYSYELNSPLKRFDNNLTLKAHLKIIFEVNGHKDVFLFEGVRNYEGFEEKLLNKLKLYQEYYNSFVPSKDIVYPPQLIIIGEDDIHNSNIYKLLLKNNIKFKNMNILFTQDVRVIEREINNIFYKFEIVDSEIQGRKKVIIEELTCHSIVPNKEQCIN